MKKKIMRIMELSLAMACTVSITGCGTQAKATNQEVTMEEETIIVTNDETSENIIVDNGDEDTATETVIAGVEEAAGDEIVGGDIVFYTEWIGKFSDKPSENFKFEAIDEEAIVEDDVIVCQAGGREVGYIKGGTTIRLIEKTINSSLYRVENTSGVGYEYVYITDDDLLTLNDMKEFIIIRIDDNHTILDTPEPDMEYIEFTIEKSQRSGVEDFICECLENENFNIYDYNTFCVECTKNGKLIDCRVYYK